MTSRVANNFQREGAISNAHVGREFELRAQEYFRKNGTILQRGFVVPVGLSENRGRQFDLGSAEPPILIECKSHTWTSSGNVPSAKITVWNETMYFFHLAPKEFRKILFVLRSFNDKRGESLAKYYVRTHGHLIPDGVEIMEFDEDKAESVWPLQ